MLHVAYKPQHTRLLTQSAYGLLTTCGAVPYVVLDSKLQCHKRREPF